jgi:ribonuclease III
MEGNQMASVADLEAGLGYRFRDAGLLRLALTHPSLAHEMGGGQQHNQRLEFLGDAVLQLIITTRLFEQYPELGEGPLTQARAQMVNRTMLAQHGRKLDLGAHLVLSRGEDSSGGRTRSSTIADAFEALIGAVYLDSDFRQTTEVVLGLYKEVLGELEVLPNLSNPKGELQELLQSTSPEPPRYELKSSSGPDHNRSFECAVTHRGQELGRGFGRSKKTAESAAAQSALDRLRQGGTGPNVENPS